MSLRMPRTPGSTNLCPLPFRCCEARCLCPTLASPGRGQSSCCPAGGAPYACASVDPWAAIFILLNTESSAKKGGATMQGQHLHPATHPARSPHVFLSLTMWTRRCPVLRPEPHPGPQHQLEFSTHHSFAAFWPLVTQARMFRYFYYVPAWR